MRHPRTALAVLLLVTVAACDSGEDRPPADPAAAPAAEAAARTRIAPPDPGGKGSFATGTPLAATPGKAPAQAGGDLKGRPCRRTSGGARR
ncbi:hypothetical protein RB614_05590 [Phytohabitans sp. ZYX-F-186]|uniref:Lipoprotein n=1 Tax=Phytohabitans maris TaxID=3071409 RepID=A0ABU0ZAA7_9ACTN|nr:hypothetical protein [Phytohabitans sp. ZYX-F-186]MDQ7903993.1 hypothetical protein [Phytohabitans sp. ZYX-F-186]